MNNLKTLLRVCLAVAILGLLPRQLQATHIVGGDMEYDIISTTDTEVTIAIKLSVYRDCFFGDPTVFFDDPAYVGVFDRDNILRGNLQLDFVESRNDTLEQGLDTFCLVNLTPVCVHTTFYTDTITLPIREGGYTFAYQRCCRNQTIVNINDPLQTGATFIIRVNDAAIARANNSPEYDRWPPIYICAGEPLVFSHSATDVDGDSLVYGLCTPFEGGTLNDPQPIPTNPPPYDTVVWSSGFSLGNLLGTGIPLAIDPETGLMTATPQTQGQFVIGVCVREYDRETGELLSVLRRDFQYNVNPCDNITAGFEAPDVQCDDLTVLFDNISVSPPLYEWYVNGVLVSSSDSAQLSQTFADTGAFSVELIAVPNTICADTFSQEVRLFNNSIEPDFFIASLNCVDSTILSLTDLSLDTVSSIQDYQWAIEFNGITINLEGPAPTVTLPSDVSGTITLTVTNTNNCEQVFVREFDSTDDNPTDFILTERSVCRNEPVELNPFVPDGVDFTYQWEPADLLNDPSAQNPIAAIDETTTFSVTVTNANEGCEAILETTITLLDSPTASYEAIPECGGISYNFNNTSTNGDSFFYDFGVTNEVADTSALASPNFTFPGPGTYTVTFIVANANGCVDTLVQDIEVNVANQIGLVVEENIVTCNGSATITPSSTLPAIYTYFDANGNLLFTGDSYTLDVSGTTLITVIATDADGCTESMTVTVAGGPVDVIAPDTVLACGADEVNFGLVSTDPNDTLSYAWSPVDLFDPATVNQAEPTFTGDFGDYEVQVITTNQFGCADTFAIQLIVLDDTATLDFSWVPECNGTTITFTNQSTATFGFVWDFGGQGTSNEVNPTFTFSELGTYQVTLSSIYGDDCIAPITQTVFGGPVDVTAPDTVLACGADEINFGLVNTDPNDEITYTWSPADLFDPATLNQAEPTFTGDFGDYVVSVIATNQFGCADTFDIQLIVLDDTATLDFSWEPECDGATIVFTNQSTATFGFQWDFAGLGSSNAENPIFSFPDIGTYEVTLSTIYGNDCIAPITRTVTVSEQVLAAGLVVGDFDCGEGSVSIDFTADVLNLTGDTLAYAWTFTEATPNSSSEENPTVVVDQSGDLAVSLTVTSEDNCTASYDTIINVQLPEIDLATEIIICPGDSTELNPDFDPSLVYSWSPAIGFDLNESNPVTGVAGVYTAIVSTTLGDINCPAVDSVEVIIADSIDLTLSDPDGNEIPQTVDNEVNADGSDVLPEVNTCGSEVPITANVDDGIIVIWTDLDGNLLDTNNPAGFDPTGRDTVIATATDQFGCFVSDTLVIVNQQVDVAGDPPSGTVTVCATQDTILGVQNLDPSDTLTYAWDDNPIIISPLDSAFVVVMPTEEGTVELTVTVSNQFGCDTVLTFEVTIDPFVSTTFPDTVNACFGEPTDINPGGMAQDGYIYDWEPAPGDLSNPANPSVTLSDDQLFNVTITDPTTGCSETDSVFVAVSDEIDLEVTPADTILCEPGSVTFSAGTLNDADVVWYDDPSLMNPIGMGNNVTINVDAEGTVTVFAVATEGMFGCMDTVSATVTLEILDDGLPAETVQACLGEEPTTIFPDGTNSTYNYIYEPSECVDATDPANPVWVCDESGTVTVTTVNPATGCSVTIEVAVTVTDLTGLVGTATPDTITLGNSTVLDVTGCDGDNCSYDWDAPNGDIDVNGSTATGTPEEPGDQSYFVTVSDGVCSETVEIPVFVIDVMCIPERVYLPNAFSPNGDNMNDVLRIRSGFINQIEEFELMIFNRWGQQMYRSFDPLDGWDGSFENQIVEPDVYGYYLRVICPDGEELIQKGNISVLR